MNGNVFLMMIKSVLEKSGIDWRNKEEVKEKLMREKLLEGKSVSEATAYADFFLNALFGAEEENLDGYKEIFRLKEMLDAAEIPYEFRKGKIGGYQLIYAPGNSQKIVCSVIQAATSYGGKEDLLEIQGLVTQEEMKKNADLRE